MKARAWLAAGCLLLASSPAAAQLGIFQGDPVDPAAGTPWVMLPGLPLVYPGGDGEYGTGDDIVDPQLTGDVDLVVRTQGTVAGDAIPPPAAGLASAPTVIAGGEHGSAGTRLPFQVITSDGATPPAAGHALLSAELDLHGALVVAYPDLDDDGVIGPTGLAGRSVEVQRQETLQMAGRRPALFLGGIAAGSMGIALGAPASAGGLGLVVAAVGTTGTTPGLYLDGPWVATALPYMLPLDPSTYFNSDGEASADGVVELELEREAMLLPAPDDPVLGAAYAIPLDGSSVTVDLGRSAGGPPVGAVLARRVDPATFVADFARWVLPVVDGSGARHLVEVPEALAMRDDGPGGAEEIVVFVADLLGNATDPAPGGTPVVVEVGASLRIVAPDADGDQRRETLPFPAAAFATLTLDDAGGAGDGAASDRIVTRVAGIPCASVRVDLSRPAFSAFGGARARLARATKPVRDRLAFSAGFEGDAQAIDPVAQPIVVALRNAGGVLYQRTIGAGSLIANQRRTTFSFRDDTTAVVITRSGRMPSKHTIRIAATRLDLGGIDITAPDLTATFSVGMAAYEGTLPCRVAKSGRSARCLR